MASNALPRGSACLTCRKKKQKCDAGKPVCSSCFKGNKECVYEPTRRALVPMPADPSSSPSAQGSSGGTPSPPHIPHINAPYEVLPHRPLPSGSPTPSLRLDLIQTFLRNKEKACFEIDEERFIASLSYPLLDSRRPHPCLIYAILLLGSYFTRFSGARSPSPPEDEERFLCEARTELPRSLEETDRLHDFIRASNLVAFYYLCKGLLSEAHQQLTQSISVSTRCGLHQIPSPVWEPASPREERHFLPHPIDNVELGERILTFWQTYCLDKLMTLALAQCPPQLVDGNQLRIVTPWPRLLQEYKHASTLDLDATTVRHLYDSRYSQIQYAGSETIDALHAQGLTLTSHALALSGTTSVEHIQHLDRAIQHFCAKLPGIRNGGEMGQYPGQPLYTPLNPRLVYINTLPHLASLFLHQYGGDETSRNKTLLATQAMTNIVNELGPQEDYEALFIGIGYLWINACEIMRRILRSNLNSWNPNLELIRHHHYILLNALRRLSRVYLVLGLFIEHLEFIA
ncbi:hypothetical protein FRC03_011185 [Tulasnella sp. 419]|nr:hypothetical protein FRC02_011646 [Tulasnella sp. 418]KAG8966864.1 hypothetical protein FRC03_011185 [Tulasnella sp. 419]